MMKIVKVILAIFAMYYIVGIPLGFLGLKLGCKAYQSCDMTVNSYLFDPWLAPNTLFWPMTLLDGITRHKSTTVRTVITTTDWKTYTDSKYKFSFKYPKDWGVGSKCENEDRMGFVGIGPELLKYPTADCGTANIPPTVYAYLDTAAPTDIANSSTSQAIVPLGKYVLVLQTGAYSSTPMLKESFEAIVNSVKPTSD